MKQPIGFSFCEATGQVLAKIPGKKNTVVVFDTHDEWGNPFCGETEFANYIGRTVVRTLTNYGTSMPARHKWDAIKAAKKKQ